MNCSDFRDDVLDFLQGSLSESRDFEAHRSSCVSCARTLEGVRENERVLSRSRAPTAPADLWPRIAAAIGRDREVPFRGVRRASLWAAVAAILLVALALPGRSSRPAPPRLKLQVQEAGPDLERTFRSLVPRYEDVDAATAMVDTLFRSDY